jgi:hypothetical protein
VAIIQCLGCKNLTMRTDDSGKFLYRCRKNKVINKLDDCPFFEMKV